MEQLEQKKRGIVRRAAGGVGKAWAYSIGITSLVREGRRIGSNLFAAGAYVRHKLSDSPANYRQESFDDAVERLSLDEVHLVRQARIFKHYAIWYFVATMVATAWLAYTPFTDRPFNAFLMAIGAIAVTGSKWLTWHFRYCQIRDQELYSFGPWFRNPGRW